MTAGAADRPAADGAPDHGCAADTDGDLGADHRARRYNYRRFRFDHYLEQKAGRVEAGGPAADAEVRTPEGERVRLSELWAEDPLVLETGSVTCPVFAAKVDAMDRLARRYRDGANFRVLYVREAHPGGRRPAHRNLEQKRARARELVEAEGVERPVLVDDLEGTAGLAYGAAPNSVHLIGTDGVISYRADWCDPDEVEGELRRLLDAGGEGAAVEPRRREDNFTRPSPGLLAAAVRVFRRAGPPSLRDFLTQAPRMIAYRLRAAVTSDRVAGERPRPTRG